MTTEGRVSADEGPADPRKPAEASVDEAVGCVGRSLGVIIIAFFLVGSILSFALLWFSS